MKTFLRKWLEIKDPIEPEKLNVDSIAEVVSKSVEKRIDVFVSNLQSYSCYNCNKGLISNRDAIYSNYQGYKYCSHTCIDAIEKPAHPKSEKVQK